MNEELDFDRFGDDFPDGRLIEPSSAKPFKLRESIALLKKLRRPLTEDEMKQFEIEDQKMGYFDDLYHYEWN